MKSHFPATVQALQNWITAKSLSPGTRLPSLQALSKQFQVSESTMLRATQALIASGSLYRQGYKLSVSKGAPASPSLAGTIYIVSCPWADGFIRAAGNILSERGINYKLIELPSAKISDLPRIIKKLFVEKPAGIIFRVIGGTENIRACLQACSLPMVVSAPGMDDLSRSSLQMDLHQATKKSLSHLYQLGHRHIALFSVGKSHSRVVWSDIYRMLCSRMGIKAYDAPIWYSENYRPDLLRERLLAAHQRHPEVTAFFTREQVACEAIRIFSVPKEMSVVGLDELQDGRSSQASVTTVEMANSHALALWACTDLLAQIQAIKSGQAPLPANEVSFVPDLVLRKSTRAVVSKNLNKGISKEHRRSHPGQSWRNVYPFLKRTGSDNFCMLDLSKLANHSMTRHHGWLGAEPLEHFPPGLRSIHGVPFQVLDEERNAGHAVITFRSPHSHSAQGKKLPARVSIPVKSKAAALYFLHGCGYSKPVAFAEYIMHFSSGRSIAVPLIPLGSSHPVAKGPRKKLQPNLQDWWCEYRQQDFPHAHHATIFDISDPTAYERTIYSLEWINPRPKEEIQSIEVRVNPDSGPILALISITVLLSRN